MTGSPSAGRVLIGVCTLNEAGNIGPLISSLRASLPAADILIVDDNSSDGTIAIVSELAKQDSAIILNVRRNQRGLGTAIRHAMEFAIDHEYEYFLNLDGDFSHDPNQLPALLHRAQQTPQVDVVVGSRYVPGGTIVGWPLRRRIMSRMVNQFARVFLRLSVADCSGSMRCYRVASLKKMGLRALTSSGYSVLEELLVQLQRHGSTFAEVPITFTERQQGASKLTIRETLRAAWSMVLLSVRP